jgi:hypothetical protein
MIFTGFNITTRKKVVGPPWICGNQIKRKRRLIFWVTDEQAGYYWPLAML